jgi:2-isopropylmalate synthase
MVHGGAAEALQAGADLVKAARDLDAEVAVDVCLADASRADHALMAHHAEAMTGAGAGLIVLADTVGAQLPADCGEMFRRVRAGAGGEVVLASHLHNDLGLGLANTLRALDAGVRVVSSSWLGIAERAGMVATEQLLFLLARHAGELLGADAAPWWTSPDLTRLPGIARTVSEETGVPLSVTTPIVGTGVGTLSTGTPFVHPRLFQPYDPEEVLGITPHVVATQLASARVVTAVAARLGHTLDREQTRAAMAWVKRRAYRTGRAVVEDDALADYLDGLTHRPAGAAS